MTRRKSLVQLANEHVPFPLAAQWAGVEVYDSPGERGVKTYCPFGEVEHPDGGLEPSLRVYQDHGWCFAETRYFTTCSLLADIWETSRTEAAEEALRRVNYRPASYAHLFEQADADPDPDMDALAQALVYWCEAHRPDWKQAQYSPVIASMLARCLGLLPLVKDAKDCDIWLSASKQAMQQVLS